MTKLSSSDKIALSGIVLLVILGLSGLAVTNVLFDPNDALGLVALSHIVIFEAIGILLVSALILLEMTLSRT